MSTPNSSAPSSPKASKSPQKHVHNDAGYTKVPATEPHRGPGARDVLLFLIASRLLNALVVQTFFQPDEYFQALEPAWELAFGRDAGAWITWEWKNHLRSAIHPAIFALVYKAADSLARLLQVSSGVRAQLLLVAPKTIQALFAAVGDYYTWKLAETTYGSGSLASAAALILTVASPWQWFCATRTFSNGLETTLTIIALYNWPWHWSVADDSSGHFQIDERGLRIRDADSPSKGSVDEITRIRRALLFAATATVLRPTNILIWSSLTFVTFLHTQKAQWLVKIPGTSQRVLVDLAVWKLVPSNVESMIFLREVFVCGSAVLSLSALVDRLFYGTWTFPPLNFLYFNVVQSLAIFYGNNNWHYYLSQGYPLLLITALPFTLLGMYRTFSRHRSWPKLSLTSRDILSNLTAVSIFVPTVLSIISHKEVRFIYPLLPGLHILAAQPISDFFVVAFQQVLPSSRKTQLYRRLLLGLLLSLNLLIALYTTSIHNSGLVDVTHYLRHEFERYYDTNTTFPATRNGNEHRHKNMTVGFLMPCHSTPWRSHLQYPPTSSTPGIDAWALTCEPPLNLNVTEKAYYTDEADQFYADPEIWLKRHMSRNPPTIPHTNGFGRTRKRNGEAGVFAARRPRRMFEIEAGQEEGLWRERKGRRPWPEYLVFFEQLEPLMRRIGVGGIGRSGEKGPYEECKRMWNSRWHEDWRRRGDVVVWCLYRERVEMEGSREGKFRVEVDKLRENVRDGIEMGKGKVTEGMALGKERLRDGLDVAKRKAERVERVVEKPFWKQTPLVYDEVREEGWWLWSMRMMGRDRREKKRSWWEGGDWS